MMEVNSQHLREEPGRGASTSPQERPSTGQRAQKYGHCGFDSAGLKEQVERGNGKSSEEEPEEGGREEGGVWDSWEGEGGERRMRVQEIGQEQRAKKRVAKGRRA
jgi:hypothetical protein